MAGVASLVVGPASLVPGIVVEVAIAGSSLEGAEVQDKMDLDDSGSNRGTGGIKTYDRAQ